MILVSVNYLYWLSCSKLLLTSQKDPSYVAIHVSSDGSPSIAIRKNGSARYINLICNEQKQKQEEFLLYLFFDHDIGWYTQLTGNKTLLLYFSFASLRNYWALQMCMKNPQIAQRWSLICIETEPNQMSLGYKVRLRENE